MRSVRPDCANKASSAASYSLTLSMLLCCDSGSVAIHLPPHHSSTSTLGAELQIAGTIPFMQQCGEATPAGVDTRQTVTIRELDHALASPSCDAGAFAIDEEQRSGIEHLGFQVEPYPIAPRAQCKC